MIQHSLLQALSSKTPRIAEGEQGAKPAAAPANGHAKGDEVQGFAAVMLAQKEAGGKLPVLPESGKTLPVGVEGLPGEGKALAEGEDSEAILPSIALPALPLSALPVSTQPLSTQPLSAASLIKAKPEAPAEALASTPASTAASNPETGLKALARLPGISGLPAQVALTAPPSPAKPEQTAKVADGAASFAAGKLAANLPATPKPITAAPTLDQVPSHNAATTAPASPASPAPIRTGDLQLLVSKAPVAAQAQVQAQVHVQAQAPALVQAIIAEEQPARAKSAARSSADALLQTSADSTAKFASIAAPAAPAPAIAQAATPLTAAAAPAAPAPAVAVPTPHNIETLVERLVQARETAQPHSARLTVVNPDFGNVALRFDAGVAGLSVSMTNADPDFAATARMALAERAIAAPEAASRNDAGQGRSDQSGQQQSSSSSNSNNAQTLMHNGAGQQQDRSGNSAGTRADHQGSPRPAGQAATQTQGDTAADTANAHGGGLYI